MKYFILLFFVVPAFACEELGNQLNPTLKKKLDAYNKFIVSLQNEKDPNKKINNWIKREGILLDAQISERVVKKYPSSFDIESITGSRKLFLRNLKLPPGLSNDIIYEVAKPDSTRAIRSWQIPENQTFLGIRGNEILHRTYLGTPCSNFHRDVLIAISPNGKFRAIDEMKIPAPNYELKCSAAKAIFKGSTDYASCVEMIDIKTRKKRIIVFQQPMS